MRSVSNRLRRDETGAAAVEFALILIPLLLIVFGIIAFGWAFARFVSITGAAREGARHMAIHGAADLSSSGAAFGEAETIARNSAALVCGDAAGCTIPPVAPCPRGGTVTFTVTMNRLVPIDLPYIPGLDSPATAEAVMRCGG